MGVKSGHLTPAVSGAQKWTKWLHNLYLLGGPQCQVWGRSEKWPLDHYHLVGPYCIGYGIKCTICYSRATSNFLPCSEALGTIQKAGVM